VLAFLAVPSLCLEIADLRSNDSRKAAHPMHPEITVVSRLCPVIIQQLQRAWAFSSMYELEDTADELRFS
jgi:hypothetical protein